ncbi:hypothetical protein K0M31_004862 [Melipona bicolor]|uniref:Uncharacterized protein n=1 Tax=Melipona bicolor TaxID=60889 RepID=A0AA40FWD3_9HYME|nr:hypothetical protein K0M31_004862 [Melipona bicolor]
MQSNQRSGSYKLICQIPFWRYDFTRQSTSINKRYSRKVKYITINCLPPPGEITKSSKLGVPHNLSERNKEDRMSAITGKNGLPMTITYVRKRQWLDKDQPPLPGPKANIHGKKILLCV